MNNNIHNKIHKIFRNKKKKKRYFVNSQQMFGISL